MSTLTAMPEGLARHLLFMCTPTLWPAWPFLPLVRRKKGTEPLGLLFDARTALELCGYSSTVFLTSLFEMPPSLDQFLKLPKEVFDSSEELLAAGWRVD